MAYEKNYWWNLSENIQGIKIHSRKDFKYYLRFPRPEINDIFSKNWYNVYLYVYCINQLNESNISIKNCSTKIKNPLSNKEQLYKI